MALTSITLRNYRAFGSKGAEIPLNAGFVAIVGLNNAGKSSALRAIYELRPALEYVRQMGPYNQDALGSDGQDFHLGGPEMLTLGPGERVINDAWPGTMPRIELAITDHELSRVTLLLDLGAKRLRLELGFADGRTSVPRTYSPSLPRDEGIVTVALRDGGTADVDWRPIQTWLAPLCRSLYVPSFRNALSLGGGRHYDLEVGSALLNEFQQQKNGSDPEAGDRVVRMTDELRQIFGFKKLEINVAATGDHFIFVVDGVQRRQSELGSGLAQFVILAVNVLVSQPQLLLIDEPELNLHAKLQLDFLVLLASLSSANVLFATHSLGLARSAGNRVLVAERLAGGECVLFDYNAAPSLTSTLGALGYGGLHDVSYDGVLLVEGVSDVKVFTELLNSSGMRGRYVLVPLGGGDLVTGDRNLELRELSLLSENIFAIVDSERTEATSLPIKARQDFAASCAEIGIACFILERRAIENYLSQDAARRIWNAPDNPAFGHYERPKDVNARWVKSDSWRVARETPTSSFAKTDLGRALTEMRKALPK